MRTCEQCGHSFNPVRPHQRYDLQACRQQAHIEREVLRAQEPAKRVSHGVGSRGGSVRSVEEARSLHEQHKAEWTAHVRNRIAQVLVSVGRFHPDDLACLEIPEIHSSIIGAQVNSFARKANVYAITEKGRRELGAAAGVAA